MKSAALLAMLPLCLSMGVKAQSDTTLPANTVQTETVSDPLPTDHSGHMANRAAKNFYYKNIIKTNLSTIALGNYGLTYERMLTRKISASLGYRFMPKSHISKSMVGEKVMDFVKEDGDEDISGQLDKLQMSGNAITAEFRIYTGKRPGAKGFYAGVYGRYSTFKFDYPYDFEKPTNETTLVPLKGNSKGIGGGVILGGQFMIAKRVVVDLFIIGAHYGKMTGKLEGLTDMSDFDEQARADLKEELEGLIEIGGEKNITATVQNDGVRADVKLPFAGVRGLGLTVGFAF